MFDFIRNHKRLMQILLMLLIIPSFAFVGISGYSSFREDNAVAKVAGKSITQQEWDAAHRNQMERYRQMFGAQFDPKMFDSPEAKQNALDTLITERALGAEVARKMMTVSDSALQQSILSTQGLIGADGKFDAERYKSLLAAQGMTPAMYEYRLRADLSLQQINSAIQSTAFTPKALVTRLSDINEQEREVQEMLVKSADYVSQVKVTDEMVKAFYKKESAKFEIPDQAKIEFVVLNVDIIASQLNVADADVAKYYEQNLKRYTVEEQRRASHILLNLKKEAPEAEKASVKAKAEALLAQVRKNPADFAKVAKESSQDTGSGERGGDLDFFGHGMMVKPFEEAAFKLKQGEISDLVQSEFGYHIIQLTGIKPGAVKSLDEVKNDIVAELKKQQATKKYSEMAEIFTNTVYEQADSLKPVVDKLKLKIEVADQITRLPSPMAAPNALLGNPKLLKAIFSDDVIKNKRNTEAVEVGPASMVAARVVEYKAASLRPLEQVQASIRAQLTNIEATALAKKAGEVKLAAFKTNPANPDAGAFAAPKTVSRSKATDINPAAQMPVMKADASKLPAFVGVELPGQGYGVYRINKVAQAATLDIARRESDLRQLSTGLAQQEMFAYLEAIKKKAKAHVIKAAADAKADSSSDNSSAK